MSYKLCHGVEEECVYKVNADWLVWIFGNHDIVCMTREFYLNGTIHVYIC